MMRKITILLLSILMCSLTSLGQAYLSQADYDKIKAPCIINELPYDNKTTEEAVKQKMASFGYKSKSSKGYDVYRGVKISELGNETYDIYLKVDKKSKKEKDKSLITMLISKGYDNFIGETQDAVLTNNAKNFLTNLINNAKSVDLDKQIAEQEDNVKKAEKAYAKSVDEGDDLQKKKRKIEEQIEENKREQEAKKQEVENQKKQLEALKSKKG